MFRYKIGVRFDEARIYFIVLWDYSTEIYYYSIERCKKIIATESKGIEYKTKTIL